MNSKDKIAETAFELFLNNGYKASTMSQLVEYSGLSKGAFYHYFKSKQDVYDYVLEHYFLKYYQELDWQELTKLNYKSFKIILNKYFSEFINEIKTLTKNKISNYFIMFFEAYKHSQDFQETVQQFYSQLEELVVQIIMKEENISNKEARIMAVKTIAQFEGLMFYMAVFPDNSLIYSPKQSYENCHVY